MNAQHALGMDGDAESRSTMGPLQPRTTKGQGRGALTTEPEDKETAPPRVREDGRNKEIQEMGVYTQVKVKGTILSTHQRFPDAQPEVRWGGWCMGWVAGVR